MAILTQVATPLAYFGTAVTPTAAGTIDATLGAQYTPLKSDEKLLFILYGGAAGGTVTFEKGNGQQGVADLDIVIGAGAYAAVQVESGKYMNVTGTNKGKIMITSTVANSTLSIYELV